MNPTKTQTVATITWPDFRRRLEAERLSENGPKTRLMARYVLNELEEILKPEAPGCLTTERIEDYQRELRARGYADMTVRRKLRVLRVALTFAVSIGAIERRPLMRLPRELSRYRARPIAPGELPEPVAEITAWGEFNLLYQREAFHALSPASRRDSRQIATQVALLLAPETVEEVAGRLEEFAAALNRLGNGQNTIANKLSRLRAMLAWHANAEARLGLVNSRQTQPAPPRPPAETPWQQLRARYEREHLSSFGARHRREVGLKLDEVERLLAPVVPDDLTASRLSEFGAMLRERQLAVTTIRNKLAAIGALLTWAAQMKIIAEAPVIRKPRRGRGARLMKGAALNDAQFARMLTATIDVVGLERAASWRHLLRGLWCSGLRLAEAVGLRWDGEEGLLVDFSGRRPLIRLAAEKNKSTADQIRPMTPEFSELLTETPEDRRTGFVFNPRQESRGARYADPCEVGEIISAIGKAAGILVGKGRGRKPKYASAHDLRRTMATRWSKRVVPAVLQRLCGHANISTTLAFYVDNDAEDLADILWQTRAAEAAAKPALASAFDERPTGDGHGATSR